MSDKGYSGWAVEARHGKADEPFLCGRYWSFGDMPKHIPQMEGHHVSLFKTRQQARAAIARAPSWYTKYRPVRVAVSVKILAVLLTFTAAHAEVTVVRQARVDSLGRVQVGVLVYGMAPRVTGLEVRKTLVPTTGHWGKSRTVVIDPPGESMPSDSAVFIPVTAPAPNLPRWQVFEWWGGAGDQFPSEERLVCVEEVTDGKPLTNDGGCPADIFHTVVVP